MPNISLFMVLIRKTFEPFIHNITKLGGLDGVVNFCVNKFLSDISLLLGVKLPI